MWKRAALTGRRLRQYLWHKQQILLTRVFQAWRGRAHTLRAIATRAHTGKEQLVHQMSRMQSLRTRVQVLLCFPFVRSFDRSFNRRGMLIERARIL